MREVTADLCVSLPIAARGLEGVDPGASDREGGLSCKDLDESINIFILNICLDQLM